MSSFATNLANNSGAPHILVVDDEARVRGLLLRWLRDAGYQCDEAGTADETMHYLQSHHADLITLDNRMPGKTGIELLPKLSRHCPDTAVIMLTAVDDTQTAVNALSCGAWGYLLKPVERQQLLFHVGRGLEHRQLVIENRQHLERLEDRVREQTASIQHAYEDTVYRLLAASGFRDEETGAHTRRVGLFSELLAQAAGWSTTRCETLRMAAAMHDVGKIAISDAILQKPGRLTPEEFEIMKKHAVLGARMLANSDSPLLQLAEQIARSHHERWGDGRGYPDGLKGTAIPEAAQIVSVVDVYDALTHDRVYRPALSEDEAVNLLLQGRGSQFDPVLLDLFMFLLPDIRHLAAEHPDEPGAVAEEFLDRLSPIPRELQAVSGSTR